LVSSYHLQLARPPSSRQPSSASKHPQAARADSATAELPALCGSAKAHPSSNTQAPEPCSFVRLSAHRAFNYSPLSKPLIIASRRAPAARHRHEGSPLVTPRLPPAPSRSNCPLCSPSPSVFSPKSHPPASSTSSTNSPPVTSRTVVLAPRHPLTDLLCRPLRAIPAQHAYTYHLAFLPSALSPFSSSPLSSAPALGLRTSTLSFALAHHPGSSRPAPSPAPAPAPRFRGARAVIAFV
jgi:hypothetical protein